MDVSDSEDEPHRKKSRSQSEANDDIERLQNLKEENDSLRCQLEAYKNEVFKCSGLHFNDNLVSLRIDEMVIM